MAAIVENQGSKQIRSGGLFAFINNGIQDARKAWLTIGFHNFMHLKVLVDRLVLEIARERGDQVNFISNEIVAAERQLTRLKMLKNSWDTQPWQAKAQDNKTWLRIMLIFQPNCNAKAPEMIGYSYFGDAESNLIKAEMGVDSTSQTVKTQSQAPSISSFELPSTAAPVPVPVQASAPVSSPSPTQDLQTMMNETKAMVDKMAEGQALLAQALQALLNK